MSVQDLVKDLVSQHNLAYRRFGKPGFLVYGTINPKVRKLVTTSKRYFGIAPI